MTRTTHDHEITIGSTTTRLTLARDKDNKALYQVSEDIPNYQKNLLYTQMDWTGGHGQFYADVLDQYFEGQSIDTTIPGKLFLGPKVNEVKEDDASDLDSAPVVFYWFKKVGLLLMATASKVYHLDAGGWDLATTSLAGVVQFAEYNGVCYAARGATGAYYTSTDGLTWTATDLTNDNADGFFVAPNPAGTQDILWKWEKPNQITSTTDGRAVAGGGIAWSSPAYIGETGTDIQNMFMINDYLFIGKSDNLYMYDSDGGVHPLLSDLETARSAQNFKYVTNWQGSVYFTIDYGIAEITSYNSYEMVGPLTRTDDINKTGYCVGLTSDKDFLYAVYKEGTSYIVYKGREITREGKNTRWEWCPWATLSTNASVHSLIVQHSSTDTRLWCGYGTNSAYMKVFDNPLANTLDVASTGWIRMSYIYGSNPYWDKMFQTVVTETAACTANVTVTPKYRKDTDTSATALTAPIVTNGTVKTDLTTALSCKRIQFQLDLATNAATATPQVLLFQARGLEKPETIRVHECTYAVETTPTRTAETLRTILRGARTSTSLIKFADLRYGENVTSDYAYVIIQPGYPQEVEVAQKEGMKPALGIKVRWEEVIYG